MISKETFDGSRQYMGKESAEEGVDRWKLQVGIWDRVQPEVTRHRKCGSKDDWSLCSACKNSRRQHPLLSKKESSRKFI